ncbi:phage major capsid protein [Mesorhizobium sp. RP14(2022)]|uniref:Phage major capsid protein n=1 Tax=Mesorhizobium liriopis TaxID=2953882 RepID=A0ABT1C1D4_9HYPH|nr:phage major capsid protein [Mesorhizobium liriopis]MCO6048634.1 phage major capsid protein [Mesorhizobium liriopis]
MEAAENVAALETKSAGDWDVKQAFGEFMTSFEAFKESNDRRLHELEGKSGEDVVTVEKVDRINRVLDEQKKALDALTLKGRRPALGGGAVTPSEHKSAFEAYVRGGDEAAIRALDTKAMSYGSGQDGGYLVPPETEAEIGKRLASLSPIRALATVRQVSTALLKKPFSVSGPATGWVAETAARPQTASATLTELQFPTVELYAMPAATQALLEDAVVDLDQWISDEVEAAFAEQEGKAFVVGDGLNKPKGFLTTPNVHEGDWTWGSLGYVPTGVAGALPASNPSDVLIDLVYALKAGYRQNANWLMNRKVQAAVRKLKDADGNYLWSPPAQAGGRASLMGFGLVEAEDMPDAAANATPIAFGDFARGYLIVDRAGVRVLRDPYSAKPYVLFYTTKRVGGGVQDFDAIKLLKYSAA